MALQLNIQNLVEPVVARAAERPNETAVIFWAEDNSQVPITNARFNRNALRWMDKLDQIGIGLDDIVLFVLGHSQELLFSFWGAMYLGALPSIYPAPSGRMDKGLYVGQVRSLVIETEIKAIISHPALKEPLEAALSETGCKINSTDELPDETEEKSSLRPNFERLSPNKNAFLQFSSGTTGAKKAVLITHQAILNQVKALSEMLCIGSNGVIINWLPLHHDMGLLGGFLLPVIRGLPAVLISPIHWVRDPKVLLWAVTTYRGTLTFMPNFAYNHLVRAVRSAEIEGIDLSSWEQILNGAEPIRYETISAFLARFRSYGLREMALTTGYGMAENTLAIALKPCKEPIQVDWVSRTAMQHERRAVPVPAESPDAISVVASGKAIPGTQILIMNEAGQLTADRQIGQIWLFGSSLFAGYFRQPELTAESFQDDWFNTGDLGYMAGDWLYVTGREKDLIIVGGKNIYPDDIENAANKVPGVHPGRVVAFGIWNERQGTEGVALVCEVRPPISESEKSVIIDALRRQMVQELDLALADVRLVEKRWIIKSSSGKLARKANRERYLQDFGAKGDS